MERTATLKFLAARGAAIGGLITAVALALLGNYPEALAAFVAAAAGFGVNIAPPKSTELRAFAPRMEARRPSRWTADAAKAEAEMKAAGVDPTTIKLIVDMILQFGPSIAEAIAKLFHHTPKPSPTK